MYFTATSSPHVVINFLLLPEPDQNMPYLVPLHPVPNSAKILRKRRNSAETGNSTAWIKIPRSAENCGPYSLPKISNNLLKLVIYSMFGMPVKTKSTHLVTQSWSTAITEHKLSL